MAHPACYLRRSYVDPESPGDISLESQRAAVRRLAEADGHGDLQEYSDWGVSADVAKKAKRTDYTRLLGDMEAGHISALYAFDTDRLYRDPRDLLRLQDAALAHSVRVVTTAGELPISDDADPLAGAMTMIGAAMSRAELQKIKKRNRAARDARISRGDAMGHPPFGFLHQRDETGRIVRVLDPDSRVGDVLAAVKEAGTILGGVRLLNERGIPSPKGGEWHTSVLTRVLNNHAPDLLGRRRTRGRPAGPALLAKLLRCHCGHFPLTPNVPRRQYYCFKGHRLGVAVHGRAHVREVDVLPWILHKAARYKKAADQSERAANNERTLSDLQRRRRAILDNYEDGHIDRPERDEKVRRVDAELDRVSEDQAALTGSPELPPIPVISGKAWARYTWEPDAALAVNRALRGIFRHIELDDQMRPLYVEWRG